MRFGRIRHQSLIHYFQIPTRRAIQLPGHQTTREGGGVVGEDGKASVFDACRLIASEGLDR
jgi:hypothetical protein